MIAVMTKYSPLKNKFDEVLTFAIELAQDKKGARSGCFETQLFSSVDTCEIQSLSFWESRQAFDAYLDVAVSGDSLMEFQSEYLRDEIQSQIYETVDLGQNSFASQDNNIRQLRIS